MENLTSKAQPGEYLDFLLEYLACSIDNSILLRAIRNSDGQVVALKSENRQYQVIDNVPCMIPELGESRDGGQVLWGELQDAAWLEYQSGDEGVFSAQDDPLGRGVGHIIGCTGAGLFLDVGCGPLSLPGYMAASNDSVSWIGIDPYFGDAARRFPFVQAVGEYLPFRPQVFDGVLYAGTVDHVIDPSRSLERTRKVIKPRGKLFVWYDVRHVNPRYIVWRIMRGLGFVWRYNEAHQWAFSHKALRALLRRAGFAVEEVIPLCERYCPDFSTCSDPTGFLAIARCI